MILAALFDQRLHWWRDLLWPSADPWIRLPVMADPRVPLMADPRETVPFQQRIFDREPWEGDVYRVNPCIYVERGHVPYVTQRTSHAIGWLLPLLEDRNSGSMAAVLLGERWRLPRLDVVEDRR